MTDDTFSEIDVPDAHVAGYEIGPDGVQFWRDPGNGQFARPGWSTAKGLAMRAIDSLGDAARLHAKEGNGKPVVLRSKGDALVDIGVPEGAPVKVRYVDDQFGLIDVKGARSTQPVKIRWDRLDAPGDAVSDAVDPTFPKVDGDPAGPLRRVKHVTGADALDPDPVGLDLRDRDFSDEDLSGVDLSTHDMSGVDLAGYEVTHSKLWSTKLDGANLRGTSFNDSILQSADLVKANAEGAKFTEADLAYTSFAYASVAGADFTGARLMKTDFTHADLTGAKFGDADLTTADLSGANLHGVDLSKAKLDAAKMGGATFDAKTKFPDGFDTSGLTNAASPASPPKNYVPPVVDTGVKEGATFARQTDSGLRVGPGTDPDVRVPWAQHVPDGTVAVGFPSGGSDASAHGRAEQAIRAAGYDPKLVDRKALGEDKTDPSISYVEITAKKDAGLMSAFADIHEAMPQTRAKKETVAVAGGDLHLQRTSKAWMLYSETSGLVTPDIPADRVDAVAEAIGELPGGATMDEVAATARSVADAAQPVDVTPDVVDVPDVATQPASEPISMFDAGIFSTGKRQTDVSAEHPFKVWEKRLQDVAAETPANKPLKSSDKVHQVTGYDPATGTPTYAVDVATGERDPGKARKIAQDLANQNQSPMRVSNGNGEAEIIEPNGKPTDPVANMFGRPVGDKPPTDAPELSAGVLSEIETGTHPQTLLARTDLSASDRSALERMVGPKTPGQARSRADAIDALPLPDAVTDGVGPFTYRKKDYDIRPDGTVMLDGKRVGEATASKVRDAAGFKTTERVLTDELKADLADVSANYPQVLSDQDMKNNPHLVDVAMAAIAHLGPEKTRRGFMKDMAAKYSPPNLDAVRGRMSPAQAKATLNALRAEIDELTDGVDGPAESKFAGDTTPAGLKVTEAVIDESAGFRSSTGIKDVTRKFTTANGPVSFRVVNNASGQSVDPPENVMVRGYTPTGETDTYLRSVAALTMQGLDGRPNLSIKKADGSSDVVRYADGQPYVSNADDVRRWAIDQLNARGFLDGTDGTNGSRPDGTVPEAVQSLPADFNEADAPWADSEMTVKWDNRTWRIKPDGSVWMNHNDKRVPADSVIVTQVKNQALADGRTADVDIPPAESKKVDTGVAEEMTEAIESDLNAPIESPPEPENLPKGKFPPTPQQTAMLEAFKTGQSMVVQAGAGAGKTSSLVMLAEYAKTQGRNGVFTAFNKAIVSDAGAKLPDNVNAATMHAIANRAMRSARPELMKRLNSKALTRDAQAKLLGITDGVQTDEKKLRPGWLAGWVLKGIDKFAMSADKEPDWTHLEPIRGLSDDENEAIAKAHLPALRAAWADLTSDDGKLRFEHATYLKLFELSNPKLGTDFVLFDECFPAGTPILTSEGYVPVDEIVDGSRRDWMVATQLSGNGVGWANVRTGYRTERRSDLVRVVHEHGTVFCTADHPFVVADGRVAAQSLAVGETLLLVQGTSDWAGEVRRGRRAKVLLQRARDAGSNDQPGGTSRVGGEGTSAGSVQSRQHVARRGGAHATQQPDAERVFAREDASDADRHGPPAVGSGWQRFGHDGTADDSARSVGDGLGRRACRVVWRGIASEGHADALQDRRSAPGAADSGGSGRGVALLDRPARIRRAEGFVLVESRVVSVTVLEPGDPDWVGVSGRANHVYTLEVDSESHTYFANGVAVGNCQDSSPVMASIIGQQRQHGTQLVYVGDADQSINGFMGAVDALSELEKVPGVLSTRLTHSFRFGPQVAEVANNVLANFSGARITGAGKPSTIGPVPNPAAILTRTNGTAMKFAIDALDEDKSVAMSPNLVKALTGFAKAAKSLREDGWTDHADLAPFASWDAVQHYVEDDPAGGDIKTLVELIDSHGPDAILSVLKNVAPPGEADVTILTAHTSKGLEFPTVRLADDFPVDQDKMNADDYRLMYVALTRAQQRLDVGANSWILRPPERPVPPFVDDAPAPAVVIPDEIPLIEDPRAPIVTKPVSTVTPVSPLTSTGGEYEAFTKRFPNGVKDSDVEADPALRDFAHKALHDVGSTLSDPPEFVTGMRAKFPKSSDKTMSVKQARATLNWLRHDIAADPARFDGFEVSAPEPIDTPVDTGPEIPDVPAPSGRGAKWSPAQIRAALRRINKSMTSLDIVNGKPVIATTSKPVDGGRAEVTRQPGIVDGDGNFVAAGPTETLTMKPKFGGPAGLEKWYGDQWSGEGVERYPLNQTPKRAALPDDGDVMDEQAPGGAFLLDDRRPGTTIDTNAHTAALVDDHNYQPFNPRKHGGAAVLLIDNEPAAVWVEGVAPTVAEVAEVVEYQGWRVVTSEGDGYDNLFSLDPAPPAERCRVAAMAHAPAQWLVAKDNYLSRIGVQAGCAVMVRHDSDQHGIIDVDQDGTLTPYPVRWDRFSNDPPGATTTLITTPRYVGNTTKAKAGAGAATEERVRVAGVGHAIIADNYLARHAPELVAGTVVPVSWVDASTAILESPGGQTIRASWSRFADEDPSAFTMDEMSVIGGNEFAALPVGTRFGVEALGAPLSTNEGRVAALVKTGDTGYTIAGDPAVEHEWDANVGAHLRLLVEKTKD